MVMEVGTYEHDHYTKWFEELPQLPGSAPDLQQRSLWEFFNITWIASVVTIASVLFGGVISFFYSDFVPNYVVFCISVVVLACFYCYKSIRCCQIKHRFFNFLLFNNCENKKLTILN
jgi:hypothetical protein